MCIFLIGAWQTNQRFWNSSSTVPWWGFCLYLTLFWSENTRPTQALPRGSARTCGASSISGKHYTTQKNLNLWLSIIPDIILYSVFKYHGIWLMSSEETASCLTFYLFFILATWTHQSGMTQMFVSLRSRECRRVALRHRAARHWVNKEAWLIISIFTPVTLTPFKA